MYGRMTRLEGGDKEEQVRAIREQVVPRLEGVEGFKGFILIRPLDGSDVSGVALWESREAMDAASEIGKEMRQAAAAGGTPRFVESEIDLLGYRG